MNTDKTKLLIKQRLKIRRIGIEQLAGMMGLKRKFFPETKSMSIDRMYTICSKTGLSIYELVEDERFKKYYNESGELIRIDRI